MRLKPLSVTLTVVLGLLASCSPSALRGLKTYSYVGGQHQEGLVKYKESPAVGGPHNPAWQNCGVYSAPLYQMYVVHSLEHGAVSITYRPGLPAAQLQILTGLARAHPYTLLSPYGDQQSPIVLSAWNAQLGLDDPADAAVKTFLDRYEQGKSAPEPGAPCSGGVSTTS